MWWIVVRSGSSTKDRGLFCLFWWRFKYLQLIKNGEGWRKSAKKCNFPPQLWEKCFPINVQKKESKYLRMGEWLAGNEGQRRRRRLHTHIVWKPGCNKDGKRSPDFSCHEILPTELWTSEIRQTSPTGGYGSLVIAGVALSPRKLCARYQRPFIISYWGTLPSRHKAAYRTYALLPMFGAIKTSSRTQSHSHHPVDFSGLGGGSAQSPSARLFPCRHALTQQYEWGKSVNF